MPGVTLRGLEDQWGMWLVFLLPAWAPENLLGSWAGFSAPQGPSGGMGPGGVGGGEEEER